MSEQPVVQLRGVKGADTINLPVVPIVFIPGVMGSRLSMPGAIDWDPDDPVAMLSWAASDVDQRENGLSVFVRPSAPPLTEFSAAALVEITAKLTEIAARSEEGATAESLYRKRGWAGAVWAFYRPILLRLEVELNKTFIKSPLHPVFCFAYDWRQSNAVNGAILNARIAGILKATPLAERVIVVTHSMGGLVARSAVQQGGAPFIASVIHTVLPSNGAVVAYRRFQTGAISPVDGDQIPDKVLQAIMGSSRADYARLQSGLPGPMQLLPNHIYERTGGSPWLLTQPQLDTGKIYETYRLENEPGIVPPPQLFPGLTGFFVAERLRALVAIAAAFHEALGKTFHPRTFVLFADKLVTDVAYDTRKNDINEKVVRLPSGDGTVPSDSGRCPGVPAGSLQNRQAFDGLEHATVFGDPGFLDAVMIRVRLAIGQAMTARLTF